MIKVICLVLAITLNSCGPHEIEVEVKGEATINHNHSVSEKICISFPEGEQRLQCIDKVLNILSGAFSCTKVSELNKRVD